MNDEKYNNLVDEVLTILTKECEIKINNEINLTEKRKMIDMLAVMCPVGVLDKEFFGKQKQMLEYEQISTSVVDDFMFKKKISNISKDLFEIKADVCVVFSNQLLCGYTQALNNLDNQIVIRGGNIINEKFYNLIKENRYLLTNKIPYIIEKEDCNLIWNCLIKVLINDYNLTFIEADLLDIKKSILKIFNFLNMKNYKNIVFNFTNFNNKENINKLKNLIININNDKKYKKLIIFNEKI